MFSFARKFEKFSPPLRKSDFSPMEDIIMFSKSGDVEGVQRCLNRDRGAIRSKTIDGYTPLHTALRYGHLDVAMLLLLSGAEFNVESQVCTHMFVNGTVTLLKKIIYFCSTDKRFLSQLLLISDSLYVVS
jgi:ankyrin repeat protein